MFTPLIAGALFDILQHTSYPYPSRFIIKGDISEVFFVFKIVPFFFFF
jgi:hypothetical protein